MVTTRSQSQNQEQYMAQSPTTQSSYFAGNMQLQATTTTGANTESMQQLLARRQIIASTLNMINSVDEFEEMISQTAVTTTLTTAQIRELRYRVYRSGTADAINWLSGNPNHARFNGQLTTRPFQTAPRRGSTRGRWHTSRGRGNYNTHA